MTKSPAEKELNGVSRTLGNPGFVSKAPPALVEAEKQKIETNRQMVAALEKQLAALEG